MARPHKQTVDYFPHDTDAGDSRTLTIIQNKFGNNGYAFWWHLLELLGRTPGHNYDYNNPSSWEFLLAKTRVSGDIAEEILTTLAALDALDPKLLQVKIIWSQNLVDRLADVYARREELPQKPVIDNVNPTSEHITANNNPVYVSNNPQTKLNKTKLNNNKGQASEIWDAVKVEIRPKISTSNYKMWIEGTEGAGIDDDLFYLGVSSEFKRDYLMNNQKHIIEDAICRASGRKLALACVVAENQLTEKTGDE